MRLSKLLVHEKDINIIWEGPIANHSFVAILPSLRNIDLQGVSLRLNAAEVDMILYVLLALIVSDFRSTRSANSAHTSKSSTKNKEVFEIFARLGTQSWR